MLMMNKLQTKVSWAYPWVSRGKVRTSTGCGEEKHRYPGEDSVEGHEPVCKIVEY
jgi:hypothetical protein